MTPAASVLLSASIPSSADALGAIDAAIASFDYIRKGDLSELKAFRTPPKAVQLLSTALWILLRQKSGATAEEHWQSLKKIADSTLLHRLRDYDRDSIDSDTITELQSVVTDPAFSAQSTSMFAALKPLCEW